MLQETITMVVPVSFGQPTTNVTFSVTHFEALQCIDYKWPHCTLMYMSYYTDDGSGMTCHVCKKNLSRFNSQRKMQHINRCIDQVSVFGMLLIYLHKSV